VGIVSCDGKEQFVHKGEGLVSSVFASKALDRLSGHAAVGHLRYSTAGGGGEENLQPIKARQGGRRVALVHNGNLTNAGHLRARFESEGRLFRSTTDTEVFAHLMAEVELGLGGVTVMVGGLTGDVSFSVTRADGAARVTEAVAGRFLILAHSRNGLDVSARLIEGDELGLCTRRWITTVSSFFRAGGRRPVRLSTPWDRISAQGERVLSVRGGDLIYPQTGDRITHSQRGTVPC
jgi:hypothetical protein